MTRSRIRPAAPGRLTALAGMAALALLLAGCEPDPVVLSFSDYLDHQGDNLTTGLISLPEDVNRHLLAYGWRLPDDEPRWAELGESVGHVRFFAADAEVRRLVLRGALDRAGASARYRVLVNGQGLGGITFGDDWREHSFDLPAEVVRTGANLLALRCLECPPGQRHRGPFLRLARLRLLPGPEHRHGICRAAEDRSDRRFRMPVPAYIDLVAEMPAPAAFRGELTLVGRSAGPAAVSLAVLDATGEHQAGEWSLGGGGETHHLRADLSPWAGRLVRLRLTASGSGELDWVEAVVTGRGATPEAGRPPLAQPAAPPRSGRLGRPDIVVVLLDAARADAFRPFGGPHPTPALEALAADGTRFTEALAPSSWTRPSVAALLTGFYPDSLGADAWGRGRPLQTPTLAELLLAAGYRTVLWHQHPFYRQHQELQRGFQEVHWAQTGLVDPVPPGELLAAAGRPTFTLVHLLPPHAPYEPPAPFRGAYSSWYRGDLRVTARLLNQFHGRRDPAELSAEDRRYIYDRYLENAAYADSLVGRILAALTGLGRYDDSLIVVLADHGETFLEHGRFLHTQQLYRESIRVPLIAKWPATVAEPRELVDQPVSLVDLVPTLVDGLALDPDRRFQGRSLLPAALDGRSTNRPIWAVTRGATESWRPPSPRVAVRHGRWKTIYAPLTDRLELYDVTDDPGEQDDLAASRPITALLFRQAVLEQTALNAGLFAGDAPAESVPLDPEMEERLRGLGYLGQQ